jgi:hypothetical protein
MKTNLEMFPGENIVNEAKRTLMQRLFHGMREGLVIALYLFVVFSLFLVHKSVVLAQHQIDFALEGFALINALALAKVILIGEELKLVDQFRDAPLIYPTLVKSFVYSILLTCFKIVEGAAVAMYHGRSFGAIANVFSGESWKESLAITVLLFVVLIPFFGFGELRRVFGKDTIAGVFLRPRHPVNLSPTGS